MVPNTPIARTCESRGARDGAQRQNSCESCYGHLTRPFDLCDETGRVLGTFRPLAAPPPSGYVETPLSEEEWQRREQEPDFATDEVIARLENL